MPKDRKPSPLRRLSSKIKSTFDADGDGKLGFSDLGAGAKKVKERAQDMADSAADAATRLLDKDGDGHLSSKDMFRMIDRDGDGKIGFKDGLADMRQANRQAKNAIYGAAKNKMLAIFEEVYRTKLKPVMTVDRYMPWHMRAVVHEVANEVWENVLMELPNSLDKILPEEKADTPRWKRKQSSDRWAAAHIRPRRRPPRASPAPLTPPAALSLSLSQLGTPHVPRSPPAAPVAALHARTHTADAACACRRFGMPNFQRPDFMKKGPSPPPSPPSLTHRSLPPSPPASPPGADTGGKNGTAVNPKERAAGTIGRAGRKKVARMNRKAEREEREGAALVLQKATRARAENRRLEDLATSWRAQLAAALDHCQVPWRPVVDGVAKFRGFLLYHYAPYDATIFAKLSAMPVSVALMTLSLWPGWYTRGVYFTTILAFLLPDLEEFQLMRFILALKGTQCISGMVKSVMVMTQLWSCVVLHPNTCDEDGPGVGGRHLVFDIMILGWLQILCWTAFILLPYSRQLGKPLGEISQASRGTKDMEKQEKAKSARKQKREEARAAAIAARRRKSGLLPSPEKGAASPLPLGDPTQYTRLLEQADEEAANAPTGSARARAEAQREELRRHMGGGAPPPLPPLQRCEGGVAAARDSCWLAVREWAHRGCNLWRWLCPALAFQCSRLDSYGAALKEYGDNRMALLLYWDVTAFFACAALYLAAIVYTGLEADNHLGSVSLSNPELWYGWQSELTYTVIKVLFQLSAVPFLPFTVGVMRTLFAHTAPTGYGRDGMVRHLDPNGLSAYVRWIEFTLWNPVRRAGVRLRQEDGEAYQRLLASIQDGKDLVAEIGPMPGPGGINRLRKQQTHIDQILWKMVDAIVKKDGTGAEHPLMYACFPDRIIMWNFEEALAESGKLKGKALREHNATKRKVAKAKEMAEAGKGDAEHPEDKLKRDEDKR